MSGLLRHAYKDNESKTFTDITKYVEPSNHTELGEKKQMYSNVTRYVKPCTYARRDK